MLNLSTTQIEKLGAQLPAEAIAAHPTKQGMSTIKPWAIYARMNEVFGIGGWHTTKELISCESFTQTTKNGTRAMWEATAKVTLHIGEWSEQYFGGSTNDDRGDAMKGATTDGLTTLCAMHLGIGIHVWKGGKHGSTPTPQPATPDPVPSVAINEAQAIKMFEKHGIGKVVQADGKTFAVWEKTNKDGVLTGYWFNLAGCVDTNPTDLTTPKA